MRKIHLYVALLGAAVGLAGCRSTTGRDKQTQPNEAAWSAVVKEALLTITRQDVAIEESYSAAIRGRQDIAIMPQVSGTLTELRVVEGERVKKGQVLFVVDQVPFRAQVETSEANVKVAEAGVATARLVYESKQQLYAEEVIPIYRDGGEQLPECTGRAGASPSGIGDCPQQPQLHGGEEPERRRGGHTAFPRGGFGIARDAATLDHRER